MSKSADYDNEATARMSRFWASGELEYFAVKAGALISPYGFGPQDESHAAQRLREATVEIYELLHDGFDDSDRAIAIAVPDLSQVDWIVVRRAVAEAVGR